MTAAATLEPPAPAGRYLSDVGAVAVAAATWLGVVVARPVPVALGAVVAVVALVGRRRGLLVVGAGLLGSGLAAAAWSGLVPVVGGPYSGPVRFVTDPGEVGSAQRVDVALADGRRVEAWARGAAAGAVRDRLAGETVGAVGHLDPPPPDAPWLAPRHVVGRLTITAVTGGADPGRPWDRLANDFHRLLADGSEALPPDQRPLLLGFVLGDDRGQDPAVVSDFRGAGLSHLLVVSGENVAFVLALVAPLVARLRWSWRLVATVAVLAWFALLTRFEPSVLRATSMAGVAAVAASRGRRLPAIRVLAIAVAVLLLVDPLLQGALGFRLSVAASAAIVVLAPPLAEHLWGPRWLRQSLAVAVAAQLGVAPVLIPAFGGIPVPSIGANLLAVPAAGPVMMWGLVAGPIAGGLQRFGAAGAASLGLLPIRLLLAWVAGVARLASAAPLGSLSLVDVAGLAAAVGLFVLAGRRGRRRLQVVALGAFAVIVVSPALCGPTTVAGHEVVARGVELWRAPADDDGAGADGGTVVTVSGAVTEPDAVLDQLRAQGLRAIDLLIVTGTGRQAAAAAATLRSRLDVGLVWQSAGGGLDEASTPAAGDRVDVGGIAVDVRSVAPRLAVEVGIRAGPV